MAMLAIERQKMILSKLQINQTALVSDLSREFNVTPETIRRDLEKLEKRGLIRKTYGGAVYGREMNMDLPSSAQNEANRAETLHIAEKVAEQIDDGDTLMLDASPISLSTALLLKQKKDLTVVTNSVEILMSFAFLSNIKAICAGGVLQPNGYALYGSATEQALNGFHVDKAIISCTAIHRDYGLTADDELEAGIKNIMAKAARKVIVAADSSQFDKIAFTHFFDLPYVHMLITNEMPSVQWRDYLSQHQIELVW
jgi:DeoR/GlpR family transcriptional regulator of sugar metabolism